MMEIFQAPLEIVYANEEKPSKEERTVLMNGVALSEKEIEREEIQNIIMFDLFNGAKSLALAQKMINERDDYFESLYDFSYGVVNLSDEPVFLGSTESKALHILDEKKAYDLRIIKLKDRYSRFRRLVSGLKIHDQHLIRNYFEHGHKVEYEELRACIQRISRYVNKQEEARGKALDDEVGEEYRIKFKEARIAEGKAHAAKHKGKKQYLINGRFEYMTDLEYQNHLKEKDEQLHKRMEAWETSTN